MSYMYSQRAVALALLIHVGWQIVSGGATEDEFEGTAAASIGSAAIVGESIPEIPETPKRRGFGLNGDISGSNTYIYEIMLLALVAMYAVILIVGRASNKQVVEKWYSQFEPYWSSQFAVTGSPETAHVDGDRYFQDSACDFEYYCTGRKNISSMFFKFALRHRHDLLMWFYDTVLYPVEDKLTIEIALSDDWKGDPALFAILNKSKVVTFRDEHAHLKEFMVATQLPAPKEGIVLLAESAEGAKEMIPDAVLDAIVSLEDYFESLFVTDMNVTMLAGYNEVRRHAAFCTIKLPRNMAEIVPLMEMLVNLSDHLSSVKLSNVAKARVEKNRRLIKEQMDKLELEKAKEAAEKKKSEKLEKEKLLYDTLSAQEKAKRDEKEEKKKKKEEMGKRFKMKSM